MERDSSQDITDPAETSSSAATGAPPFYITSTGQVRTPYGTYDSLQDWYAAPEFRRESKCKVYEVQQRPTRAGTFGDLGPLASPDDCTTTFTKLEQEYALQDYNLVIPVVFHNIVRETDNVGYITDEQILSQIEILNEDFGKLEGTPGDGGAQSNDVHIRFVLAGINRVQNDNWFDYPATYEHTFKDALNWDPNQFLNVYTVGFADDDEKLLGWSYFPQGAAGLADTDGVVLLYDTVGRDGSNPPYDQGRTMTHEVGHYLGLDHTFAPNDDAEIFGVCENGWDSGDLIQDTPEEGEPVYGCPAQYQTCGMDVPSTMGNVHNYMDYADDTCMFYFTIQQANRTVCSLVNYRAGLYRDVPATYNVDSYVKTTPPGVGTIHTTKQPVPAGSEIALSTLPTVPSKQPAPTWNARLRLRRKPVGQTEWEMVAEDLSSGMTPAGITHTVPTAAFYRWSVTHEDGGAPAPYTANITYLSCSDPDQPDGIKDIPECQF